MNPLSLTVVRDVQVLRRVRLCLITMCAVVALDQATKSAIIMFGVSHVSNQSFSVVLALDVALAALGCLLGSRRAVVAGGMVLGGGIGNWLDSLSRKNGVVDFVPVASLRTNLADLALVGGLVLLVLATALHFRSIRRRRSV